MFDQTQSVMKPMKNATCSKSKKYFGALLSGKIISRLVRNANKLEQSRRIVIISPRRYTACLIDPRLL